MAASGPEREPPLAPSSSASALRPCLSALALPLQQRSWQRAATELAAAVRDTTGMPLDVAAIKALLSGRLVPTPGGRVWEVDAAEPDVRVRPAGPHAAPVLCVSRAAEEAATTLATQAVAQQYDSSSGPAASGMKRAHCDDAVLLRLSQFGGDAPFFSDAHQTPWPECSEHGPMTFVMQLALGDLPAALASTVQECVGVVTAVETGLLQAFTCFDEQCVFSSPVASVVRVVETAPREDCSRVKAARNELQASASAAATAALPRARDPTPGPNDPDASALSSSSAPIRPALSSSAWFLHGWLRRVEYPAEAADWFAYHVTRPGDATDVAPAPCTLVDARAAPLGGYRRRTVAALACDAPECYSPRPGHADDDRHFAMDHRSAEDDDEGAHEGAKDDDPALASTRQTALTPHCTLAGFPFMTAGGFPVSSVLVSPHACGLPAVMLASVVVHGGSNTGALTHALRSAQLQGSSTLIGALLMCPRDHVLELRWAES